MKLGPIEITGEINTWSAHRPGITAWRHTDSIGIALWWGNGNSDPVWEIAIELRRAR